MKSLEMVNSKTKGTIIKINFTLPETLQIKADLEVLEIIREKKVNVAIFMNFLKIEDNEKILEIYNYINYAQSKLTLEEIVKIKQWLEENKDENI